MITRGCPFRCLFCSSTVWGKTWSHREAEDIIAELKLLREAGFKEIFFQDDTINVDVAWAHELFTAIHRSGLGLKYKLQMRVNEKMLPESLLASMAEAGVEHVFLGVESANDAIREAVAKGIAKDEIRRAVALAKKYSMKTTLAFITGLPGETRETALESMAFVRELQPYEAGFSTAIPFPGSPMRAWAAENGFLEDARLEALRPGKSVMRTAALSCREIEELRHQAEHETAPFTTRSANTAEARCDHLIAVLLDFKRGPETARAVPFVMLALSRAALDVHLGWEPCIAQAHRLLGGELSAWHRAKARAMLGVALALVKQPDRAVIQFQAAESAGFPEIAVWCREKYASLGFGGQNLLPQPGEHSVPPQIVTAIAAALRQSAGQAADIFITGLPEETYLPLTQSVRHTAFPSADGLLDALLARESREEKRVVLIIGAFSRPATEAELFQMLMRCRAASGADTLWVFYDVFGPGLGDMLRGQPKHISRGRTLELAVMAGFSDVTGVDACLVAALAAPERYIDPARLLVLRDAMPELEYKKYVLEAHKTMRSRLADMRAAANGTLRENMARLVADNAFHLTLRYACAETIELKNELYAASRVIDYQACGQWQRDYAAMVKGALRLSGEKLLDFGCAYGSHVLAFRLAGVDARGVDVNREFLHKATPAVAGYLRELPTTNPAALLDMFPPRSFAAIIATEVFEHVPHEMKKEYVRLFARLLAPGGSCVITCPTGEQDFENLHGGGILGDPQHANLMTDAQMRTLFADAGFEDASGGYQAHVRGFQGKDGFSFWRTYCSGSGYFCFRLPGERPRKTPAMRARALFITAHTFIGLALGCARIVACCPDKTRIKQSLRAVIAVAATILPESLKNRLKATALGAKIRRYIREYLLS